MRASLARSPAGLHCFRLIGMTVLALVANGASAQYAWVDDKGIRHFSDRPPPASVPARNILKQPASAAAPAPGPAAAVSTVALADREADFRKRVQQRAEREQQASQDARQRKDRRAACDSWAAYLTRLNAGGRVEWTAPDGQRAVMGEADRAREIAAARRLLSACQ